MYDMHHAIQRQRENAVASVHSKFTVESRVVRVQGEGAGGQRRVVRQYVHLSGWKEGLQYVRQEAACQYERCLQGQRKYGTIRTLFLRPLHEHVINTPPLLRFRIVLGSAGVGTYGNMWI